MSIKRVAAVAMVAGLCGGLAWSPAEASAMLAAHRAVYDLHLNKATDRSGVDDVVGRMVVEVTGAPCEGWSVSFRLVNRFDLGDGGSRTIDSRSNSWESDDGLSMRYASRQFVDGRLEDESLLKAQLAGPDDGGSGEITKPEPKTFVLAPHTLFPAAHQKHLVEQAIAGASLDKSLVYDGADGSNSYHAITFIGAEKQADTGSHDKVSGNGGKELANWRGWPVTISYYKADDATDEGVPDYQVSFHMFENGVAGKLVLDYGDFTLDGSLSELDMLDQAKCP